MSIAAAAAACVFLPHQLCCMLSGCACTIIQLSAPCPKCTDLGMQLCVDLSKHCGLVTDTYARTHACTEVCLHAHMHAQTQVHTPIHPASMPVLSFSGWHGQYKLELLPEHKVRRILQGGLDCTAHRLMLTMQQQQQQHVMDQCRSQPQPQSKDSEDKACWPCVVANLVPAVVHEALQGHQPCIYQPWDVGAFGLPWPLALLLKSCHHTLPAPLFCQPNHIILIHG